MKQPNKRLTDLFGPDCHNKNLLLADIANYRYCYFEASGEEQLRYVQKFFPSLDIYRYEMIKEKWTYRFYRTSLMSIGYLLGTPCGVGLNLKHIPYSVSGVLTNSESHDDHMTWIKL
jgi:hypothetical protein